MTCIHYQLELRFDGDSQCHLMYGTDWRLYPSGIVNGEQINICRAIWCRRGNSLRSPNAAALQVGETRKMEKVIPPYKVRHKLINGWILLASWPM